MSLWEQINCTPESWMSQALCTGASDPDDWFPDNALPDSPRVLGPVGVCKQCPVQAECLEFALRNDERWGIWGGVDMSRIKGRERRPVKYRVQRGA